MFYYIYKTINLITGTYYIGKHTSKYLENDYLGSGDILKHSIKKYGRENFKKKILFILKSEEEAYQKEKEIVNEELIKDPSCMNIKLGGNGFRIRHEVRSHVPWNKGIRMSEEQKKKISKTCRIKGIKPPSNRGLKHSEETKKKISEGCKNKTVSEKTREKMRLSAVGKKLSKETKEKISKTLKFYYRNGKEKI